MEKQGVFVSIHCYSINFVHVIVQCLMYILHVCVYFICINMLCSVVLVATLTLLVSCTWAPCLQDNVDFVFGRVSDCHVLCKLLPFSVVCTVS